MIAAHNGRQFSVAPNGRLFQQSLEKKFTGHKLLRPRQANVVSWQRSTERNASIVLMSHSAEAMSALAFVFHFVLHTIQRSCRTLKYRHIHGSVAWEVLLATRHSHRLGTVWVSPCPPPRCPLACIRSICVLDELYFPQQGNVFCRI